jgi:hypothetical protein
MTSKMTDIEPVIAIVDAVCDVEETCQPFGKRWGGDCFTLTHEHLDAFQSGKLVALDVQGEYVAFVRIKTGD